MRLCTPLKYAAAMLKLSDQSDPDVQRYLRHTYTDRQRFLAFIEKYVFCKAHCQVFMVYTPLHCRYSLCGLNWRKKGHIHQLLNVPIIFELNNDLN